MELLNMHTCIKIEGNSMTAPVLLVADDYVATHMYINFNNKHLLV